MSHFDDDNADETNIGQLAHRMNNALAYVLTNLNLLVEEVEMTPGLVPDRQHRLMKLTVDATGGADRLGELIRELQVLGSHDEESSYDDASEDTWDSVATSAHLMVIDDEEPILTSLTAALARYRVSTFQSPEAAIERLQEGHDFDLILCDLVMPEMSGIDIYQWMLRNRRELVPRMMFMTGGAFTQEMREFVSGVRNVIMHKPFDNKTLRWMVAQQLRQERLRPDSPTPS